jgi:hypothetical protein
VLNCCKIAISLIDAKKGDIKRKLVTCFRLGAKIPGVSLGRIPITAFFRRFSGIF